MTATAAPPAFDRDATSIRAVIPTPVGGYIAMAGFPGLQSGIDGTPYLDPEHMGETLNGLRRTGARVLMVLTEEEELPSEAFALLRAKGEEAELELVFGAIEDFGVPQASFLDGWPAQERRFLAALQGGETVALCCQYGAGRSGLIAARLLMAGGLSAEAAITLVRSHFGEAIENADQENWLRDHPAA